MIQKEDVAIGHIAKMLMSKMGRYYNWYPFFERIGVKEVPIELKPYFLPLFIPEWQQNIDNVRLLVEYYFYKEREYLPTFLEEVLKIVPKVNSEEFNLYLMDLGYELNINGIKITVVPLKDSLEHLLSDWPSVQKAYIGAICDFKEHQTDWERKTVTGLRTAFDNLLRIITNSEGKIPPFTHSKKEDDSVVNRYIDQMIRQGNFKHDHRESEGKFLCGVYAFLSTYGTHSAITKDIDAEFAVKINEIVLKRILKQLKKY